MEGVDRNGEKNSKAEQTGLDTGPSPRCGKGFFIPESASNADCLTVSLQPRVQSHAATSVSTLQIPNIGSHTIVWTHGNTAHTDKKCIAALVTAMAYPGEATRIFHKGQKTNKK